MMPTWLSAPATLLRKLVSTNASAERERLLVALADGSTLKSHRDVDGDKQYVLHHLDGTSEPIGFAIVDALKQRSALDSNKKFPAETYLLTQIGQEMAMRITLVESRTVAARNV